MNNEMKKFIPLFILFGIVLVGLAIYIIVYHVGMPMRGEASTANFWLGLWQGAIVFLSFVASWFDGNVVLYQVNNNGFWYNLGYFLGLCVAIGGGAGGSQRKNKKASVTVVDVEVN